VPKNNLDQILAGPGEQIPAKQIPPRHDAGRVPTKPPIDATRSDRRELAGAQAVSSYAPVRSAVIHPCAHGRIWRVLS
jgi:hypothetical protein